MPKLRVQGLIGPMVQRVNRGLKYRSAKPLYTVYRTVADCHKYSISLSRDISHGVESALAISQLPNLFIGTPRIYNFILLLIVWVRSFSKMLPYAKFAEDKVLFLLFSVKNAKNSATLSLTLILTLISRAN